MVRNGAFLILWPHDVLVPSLRSNVKVNVDFLIEVTNVPATDGGLIDCGLMALSAQ